MASSGLRPARRPVATMERRSACAFAPHSDRKPFVTLRKITDSRNACSLTLLVGSTSCPARLRHDAANQEHQELVARRDLDGVAQFPASGLCRFKVEQPFEPPRIVARGLRQRGVGHLGPALADAAQALQKRVQQRRKDRVAALDSVLRVADQMRETILVPRRVRALGRETIRHPHVRLGASQKVDGHAFTTRRRDDVIHGRARCEDPLPEGFSVHARHAGGVRGTTFRLTR